MTNPTLVTTPFAENGDKNTIPQSVGAEPQNATQDEGFPEITQTPISAGGIPPERKDFNGILNLYGQHIVHLNKGLPYEFDAAFATAIGGYPLHARIMLSNGDIVRNTVANNSNNPNVNLDGWYLFDSKSAIIKVNSVNDLSLISNPLNNMLVKTLSYNTPNYALKIPFYGAMIYKFNPDRADENDGGSIINGWEAQFPELLNISADWFGADPNGVIESTDQINKATTFLTKNLNSVVLQNTNSGTLNFSAGTYLVSEAIIKSGVTYAGAGEYATNFIPAAADKFCFTTSGTSSVPPTNGTYTRCDGFTFKDMYFGNLYAFTSNVRTIPDRAGAINLEFCSRYNIQNVTVMSLKGSALRVVETWDCDITNFKAISCGGYESDNTTAIPAIYIGRGANDASNAMRFRYIRLENNVRSLHISAGTRHCVFSDIKIEGGTLSNIIEGAQGIVFSNPELTWKTSTVPMFKIKLYPTGEFPSHDSSGVTFISPQCISASYTGWYFDCDDAGGQVEIISPYMRSIKTLISGAKFSIIGGDGYDVGSDLVKMTGSGCKMIGVTLLAVISGSTTDGTSDTVQITGSNCQVEDNTFVSKSGSLTDGQAFINIANNSARVRNNGFGGSRQWGIRSTSMSTSGGLVRDNYLIGVNVASILSNSALFPEFTLTTRSQSGLGLGTLESLDVVTINDGLFSDLNVFNHGTLVVLNISNTITALIMGTGSGGISLISTSDPKVKVGSGVAGDGNIYLSKPSFSAMRITNFTGSPITARTTKLSTLKS